MLRKIGACSWIFGDTDIRKIAQVWQSAGLDGVEYNPVMGVENAREACEIFADHGLMVFSLTPPDADISIADNFIRNKALDCYYWLIDYACQIGAPVISCHGLVGRITAKTDGAEEDRLLLSSLISICKRAKSSGISVVFEVLNRYETHQIRNYKEAETLLLSAEQENLALLLDSYHMNIEEPDPARSLHQAGASLRLYHIADSNREVPGRGHIDFVSQFRALDDISYQGPVILEINAPGPNPFSPIKGTNTQGIVASDLSESVSYLRKLMKDKAA
ncbi:sugar phosphate isomerase/epimerase [Kiloniella laminariae]|uniref:Sugar phosphate isomerase/epimerase n=1 Tax=Kiloniella laminariae TaxID=454162 RepID=A0ABT4LGY4_9PROT|nr:sugar phosphate isomerase/epimerase family protein [Kiloniella laminariae]MCZ4280200.1 sugar phosphate isomerase/epimerase [Kiloniella laminariae]